eukprot:3808215-Pleurochrysis_carterae.AAC.2
MGTSRCTSHLLLLRRITRQAHVGLGAQADAISSAAKAALSRIHVTQQKAERIVSNLPHSQDILLKEARPSKNCRS